MSEDTAVMAVPAGCPVNLEYHEYIGYQLVVTSITSAALSALFLGLRLYTRKYIVNSFGWDDWWLVCAWLSGVALTIADCIQTEYGVGFHLCTLETSTYDMFLKVDLIIESTYITSLAFAKASICCFYLRLSPEYKFRIFVFALIALTASYSIATFLVAIFSCHPLAASWNQGLQKLQTTICLNHGVDYLIHACFNILTDILVIILPLPMIWKLQLPFRQKMSISSVFAIGIFVCIVSIIRLKYVIRMIHSPDVSWDTNSLLIWSSIQVHVTIICACLAALKPLAARFFPKIFGRSISGSNRNSSIYAAPAQASIPRKTPKLIKNHRNENYPYGFTGHYPDTNNVNDIPTFDLKSYRENAIGRSQHQAIVTTGAMARRRDDNCYDGDSDSQRGIGVDGMEHDMEDFKEAGVFVTRTVHVS